MASLAVAAAAADAPTPIDSLLARGRALLADAQLDSAETYFEAILASDQDDVGARLALGDLERQRRRWGRAEGHYERVLDSAPENLEARFGLGICKREIGTTKALVQRRLAWGDAEKHLSFVAERDSTYEDVWLELATLERYRDNFFEAVELAHKQLALRPDEATKKRIFRLYDHLIANTKAADAIAWLERRGTPIDRYALGETYRREGNFARADSILSLALEDAGRTPAARDPSSDVTTQPILLALVRLYVETERPQKAHDIYWEAVETTADEVAAHFIREDLWPIVNRDDYECLQTATPATLAGEVVAFWNRRDPLPAAPYNVRLIEHYRRLVVAERDFRYDGFRLDIHRDDAFHFRAFPDWYADNTKFDDRGLIYMRFGEPDDRAFVTSMETVINMSWLYRQHGSTPKLIFHFTVPENAPPSYWVLIPLFPQREILQEMVDWDPRYLEIVNSVGVDRVSRFYSVQVERFETVGRALQSDRHSWSREVERLPGDHRVVRFRTSPSTDVIEVSYAIPLETLAAATAERDSAHLETGVALLEGGAALRHEDRRTFDIDKDLSPGVYRGDFIDTFTFEAPPGAYEVAMHARIPEAELITGWRYAYPTNETARDRLYLSSLKLAHEITAAQPAARSRTELAMIPNPSHRFEVHAPVFAYFEIYNLAQRPSGETSYTVRFTLEPPEGPNFIARVAGWFGVGKRYTVSIESEGGGTSATSTDYVTFDVEDAPPGRYRLELVVEDRVSGEKASTAAELELVGATGGEREE